MSYTSELSFDLSPVRLSYVAALRGVKPRNPRDPFTYAQIGAFTPLNFLCMAASNPQGTFYALIEREALLQDAQKLAARYQLENARFISSNEDLPDQIDYICYENIDALPQSEEPIFGIVARHLSPSGLFCYRYLTAPTEDDILRFLVEEYAPELSDAQALEFLQELKSLGLTYFQSHPVSQNALNRAIEQKDPSLFFTTCIPNDNSTAKSGAFEVMQSLLPRGFSFAGSADIGSNYLQLTVPPEAHAQLEKCKDQLLYEPIKDFALNRKIRSDVWVKQPVNQSERSADLFGLFTYGITRPRGQVPSVVPVHGSTLRLDTPLFTRLIDLMCSLPMGIGDFLQHPSGQGMDPEEVVAALQVLVACGIAQPMRSHYENTAKIDLESPSWSVALNAYLNSLQITEPVVQLASPIVGSPLTIPARDALVLQALHRAGMKNSAGILQPALKELVQNHPKLAAQIMDATDPTDEVVHTILTNTLSANMTRWYAYGLLAA